MMPNIFFEDEDDIVIDLSDELSIVAPKEHKDLLGLDYEEAGHTGFTPSRLSLLNNVDSEVSNDRLVVMANVDNVASKITARDLQNRMIRTASSRPIDLQVGQYLFLEINNNNNQEQQGEQNNG